MPIETLDDVLEDLANKAGVYGACPSREKYGEIEPVDDCPCRVCFLAGLRERVIRAVEIETIVAKYQTRGRLRQRRLSPIVERTKK